MANVILESSRGIQPVPIEDELLRKRMIFLTDDVNHNSCAELIVKLMYLDSLDSNDEITLYINSPGGNVQDGLAVYDLMKLIKSPIRTVCVGTCASMGAIIFLGGGRREMMTHGKIMIHDPAFGGNHDIGGMKSQEIQAQLDDLNRCRESLASIISERTGKSLKEIYKVTAHDTYFTAEEAITFGLATGIMEG